MIVLLIIVFSVFSHAPTGILGAFLTGVWYDVWHGNPLGETSLVFLAIALCVNGYKRKFTARTIWFLVPFSTVTVILTEMVVQRTVAIPVDLVYLGYIILTTVFFYIFFSAIWRMFFTPKKLSV